MPLSQIGTRVVKPPGIAGLAKWIKNQPQFKLDNQGQNVSLAKK